MTTRFEKSEIGDVSTQPAEQSAITKPTVAPGLGYPANREEESPTPIGWQATRFSGPDPDLIKIEN